MIGGGGIGAKSLVGRRTGQHDGRLTFPELVVALQEHWESIKSNHSNIDHIDVIGIDLTARSR